MGPMGFFNQSTLRHDTHIRLQHGKRRRQHTRRQQRSSQRAVAAADVVLARRRCSLASFTATASRAATTATWHSWRRPVRPRADHGGGTRFVNDGVVEQRGVPGRLQTTASIDQFTGAS